MKKKDIYLSIGFTIIILTILPPVYMLDLGTGLLGGLLVLLGMLEEEENESVEPSIDSS